MGRYSGGSKVGSLHAPCLGEAGFGSYPNRGGETNGPCLSGWLPSGSNAKARSVQRDAEKALGETFASSAPLRLTRSPKLEKSGIAERVVGIGIDA